MSDNQNSPASSPSLNELLDIPTVVKDFDEKQLEAINACVDPSRRIVPITGAAGTGKTTIIREVYARLKAKGLEIAISAPTGKAAKRIQEATGLPALTNHKLLGYGMPIEREVFDDASGEKKKVMLSTKPMFDRNRPLPYDIILADEYSMVNNEIHSALMIALKNGARICVFGDVNQLKPIEENKQLANMPSPFEQLLAKFSGIVLATIHRQSEGSGIVVNGSRILQGRAPMKFDDFTIITTDNPIDALFANITDDYKSLSHQIISPMNKSWVGVTRLNVMLQNHFWISSRDHIEIPRHTWAVPKGTPKDAVKLRLQVGSKVVYTKNVYDLGNGQSVFNGETGIVEAIDMTTGAIDVDFTDRIVTIPPYMIATRPDGTVFEDDPRKNIDLAYALTTHKMQGSECTECIYLINKSTIFMANRRAFYTAITRAKKRVIFINDSASFAKGLRDRG